MAVVQPPSNRPRGLDQRRGVDDLVDRMMARYVSWREDAASVREAYRRWCAAPADQEQWLFDAYRKSLDQEGASAASYAQIVAAVELSVRRDRN